MFSFLSRHRNTTIASLMLLAVLAFYPFESAVVPPWTVHVMDVNGTPCGDMPVTQTWSNYSWYALGGGESEHRNTNQDGYVNFPARSIRASGLRRIIMPPIARALTIAHGSYGIDATVFTNGLKDVAWLSYKPGETLPKTARVERCLVESDLHPK
jgi:hypothetical protein